MQDPGSWEEGSPVAGRWHHQGDQAEIRVWGAGPGSLMMRSAEAEAAEDFICSSAQRSESSRDLRGPKVTLKQPCSTAAFLPPASLPQLLTVAPS